MGLFLAERDQEHGRAALRKALYLLPQSLGEEVIVGRGDPSYSHGSRRRGGR